MFFAIFEEVCICWFKKLNFYDRLMLIFFRVFNTHLNIYLYYPNVYRNMVISTDQHNHKID
ncbi:hypothetical protein BpHYR1_029710 [Brachionus plicatilis]|uniref:Uncharacterized protein n=1 Tax=Brachionus plicatilis TaxID=10195 RepID=A0A3M7PYP1_BRAPC|nr:hypothetical protein BpHYR1_029710 [Brachionus plicatilis]